MRVSRVISSGVVEPELGTTCAGGVEAARRTPAARRGVRASMNWLFGSKMPSPLRSSPATVHANSTAQQARSVQSAYTAGKGRPSGHCSQKNVRPSAHDERESVTLCQGKDCVWTGLLVSDRSHHVYIQHVHETRD